MKNILVTTDFSPHSRYSLEYTVKLVQHESTACRILLLNTYMIPILPGMITSQIILLNDKLKNKSKELLEQERLSVGKFIDNSKITIHCSSHIGTFENVVHQLLDSEKFDLLVIGKDGGRHIKTITAFLTDYDCRLLVTYLK